MTNDSELESAPTQQPLEVPDIYLAELVGVIRRALQADGLTKRLWAILDDWCDEGESYLEKKYPEAHEQAESGENIAVDWLNSRGPVFPGLDTFIRTGYRPPTGIAPLDKAIYEAFPAWEQHHEIMEERKSFMQEDYEAIKARTPGGVNSPNLAAYREFVVEFMERGQMPERAPFSLEDYEKIGGMLTGQIVIDGIEIPVGNPGAPLVHYDGMAQRLEINETDAICTCQAFQGDNPQCAFHGEGTAWHDLHRGE